MSEATNLITADGLETLKSELDSARGRRPPRDRRAHQDGARMGRSEGEQRVPRRQERSGPPRDQDRACCAKRSPTRCGRGGRAADRRRRRARLDGRGPRRRRGASRPGGSSARTTPRPGTDGCRSNRRWPTALLGRAPGDRAVRDAAARHAHPDDRQRQLSLVALPAQARATRRRNAPACGGRAGGRLAAPAVADSGAGARSACAGAAACRARRPRPGRARRPTREDGQVVLLSEQFAELVGADGQAPQPPRFLAARLWRLPDSCGTPREGGCAPERFGGVAQVLDALAPLVHRPHTPAALASRAAVALAALPVDALQPSSTAPIPGRPGAARPRRVRGTAAARRRRAGEPPARAGVARPRRARRRACVRIRVTPLRSASRFGWRATSCVERAQQHLGVAGVREHRRQPPAARPAHGRRSRPPSSPSSSLTIVRSRLIALRTSCTALRASRPGIVCERFERDIALLERHPPQPGGQPLVGGEPEPPPRPPARASAACPARAPGRGRSRRSRRGSLPAARQWSDDEPSARAMVDGAASRQPKAIDVSLSDLWSSSAGPQRAYADRPRRGHPTAPPRAHGVRAAGPSRGPPAAPRGVARDPTARPSLWRRLRRRD